MQVEKIGSYYNVNFKKQDEVQKQVPSQPQQQENTELPKAVSTPPQLCNINIPVSYTKTNEFILPGTDTKVHMYKLSNGQTVVLAPKKGQSQISTYIKCGGMNEPENLSGISHYIEHNLFNGSRNIDPKQFFGDVNKMGGYTNAYTGSSNTCYYVSSPLFDSEDLQKIIEMHSDMVQYPKFEQAQLDKEKGVVNSEITMYDDENFTILAGKALKQLFQIDSTSNDLVCGTVKNINNLTRDDVVNYYNRNYTPDRMITVLTGEFEPESAMKLLAKNFNKPAEASQAQHQVELKPIESSKKIDYFAPKISTDEFMLSFKGPDNKDIKGQYCMDLIALILCGGKHAKLTKNLEKYNVVPDFGMDRTGAAQNRPFVISLAGACKGENTEEALKTIYSTIYNMQSENLNEDLEIAKKNYIKSTMEGLETSAGTNNYLGLMLQNKTPDDIVKMPETVKAITQEDIKSALKKFMDLNKASIVVAHPQSKTNSPSFKGKLKKEGLNLKDFTQTKLPNNINVYLKNDRNDLKTMILTIDAPVSAYINPVLPDVMTKLLQAGQYGQSDEEFSKDMAKHCVKYDIQTTDKGINIIANALNSDINYALEKVTKTLSNPKFTQQDFEKAKKQVEQEILESQKSPTDYIYQVMFPQLQSAPTKEDKLKALSELKLGDVMGYMQYLKQNAGARFIWNKNEIPYELMKLPQLKPVSTEKMKTYMPLEQDVIKTQTDDNGQAKITQSFKFERTNNLKEDMALDAMNIILGSGTTSRLFNDLRESQKLCYSVRSNTENYGNTGIITLSIGTTTDSTKDPTASSANITKSLDGFKKHIEKMMKEPVTQEELDAAKLKIKANILNSIETNADKMASLLNGIEQYNNPDYSNCVLKTVDELTPDDIQRIAQKVFAGHSLTSIVANENTLKDLHLLQ